MLSATVMQDNTCLHPDFACDWWTHRPAGSWCLGVSFWLGQACSPGKHHILPSVLVELKERASYGRQQQYGISMNVDVVIRKHC